MAEDEDDDDPGPPYPPLWAGDSLRGHAVWCGARTPMRDCTCGYEDYLVQLGTSAAEDFPTSNSGFTALKADSVPFGTIAVIVPLDVLRDLAAQPPGSFVEIPIRLERK